MCSNFGFNHHPGRPPCALESHWYYTVVRWIAWLRLRFVTRSSQIIAPRSQPRRPL
ncbi:MAG: hypothetical protein ACLPPV_12195 [Candidatus Korobacteraceae bacterium]